MAKKKAAKKEISRKEINGNIIITFDDGSIQIIPAPIDLTAEEAESIFGEEETEEEEEEEETEEEDDSDEDDSEEEEEENGEEAVSRPLCDECENLRSLTQIRDWTLHQGKSEEEEAESYDEFADVAQFVFLGKAHDESETHQRHGEGGDVSLETEDGDDPCRHGRSDVRSHDDPDCLSEGQETCAYESDNHYGGRAGWLDCCCYSETCENSFERVGGHCAQKFSEAVSCRFLETRTHHVHSVEEHSEGSQQGE